MAIRARSDRWHEIYERKARGAANDTPLHVLDGYDMFTENEWHTMVQKLTAPLNIRRGDVVVECGVGSGAFVDGIYHLYPGIDLYGCDYSESLVKIANERVNGTFAVADITDLSIYADRFFDKTLSCGVFVYLNSFDDASKAFRELVRITKPGGMIYIGEVNDEAKRAIADNIRRQTHSNSSKVSTDNPDHIYYPKAFFTDLAASMGLEMTIVDHSDIDLSYPTAPYRYSVYAKLPELVI